MCGIFGEVIYGLESLTTQEKFISLLNLSRSRGPDSQGYFTNEKNFQFGFNRLAILDLSDNGNQPIQSSTGRYTMIFNGEIYNHEELRKSLPDGKYTFKGNGDTESLIACFDQYGVQDTVHKLDGMFAIGIYDNQETKLHLIRDFAGIKPLHYGWNGKILVFASQFNQISGHKAFYGESVNEEVLKLYLTQHFIPAPFGLLMNTFSVYPGEIVSFDFNGNKHSEKYWSFPEFIADGISLPDILVQIEDELENSVHSELMADVPLGAFLSGGIDSPLVCRYAAQKYKEGFNTFSIGSDSEGHDESHQAEKFAKVLQSDHNLLQLNAENTLQDIESIISSTGEPLGDFSLIPTWMVSKLARTKVKVILSGDGGDELFFGYERFRSIAKNHSLWGFPYWIRYLTRGIDKLCFNERHYNECVLASSPGVANKGLHSRFPPKWLYNLAPDLGDINTPESFDIYNYSNPKSSEELLYKIRKAEFYGMMQKTLKKVDSGSMAHGLEVRVPFLKKSFIEKILSINISAHEPLIKRKKFLYKLLEKNYPSIKAEQTKLGFSIPLSKWLKQDDFNQHVRSVILDPNFCNSYGFNKKSIEKMLAFHITDRQDFKWPLFSIYSLAIWDRKGRTLA